MAVSTAEIKMYRKLVVIGLALALIGVGGTAVTADEGAGPVVADHDVTEDLSLEPDGELDGGAGGGGDTCSISPDGKLDGGAGGC